MRRSQRVEFEGGSGFPQAGIVDLPDDPPKAVVLLTHCFTCNKDLKAIVRISRALAQLGFAVLRFDLTGLGGSRGDFSQTNFSTNQADLRAAAEFASREIAPPSFLIGHSFGAACSLSLLQSIDSVLGAISIAGPSDTCHLADLLQRMDPKIASEGIGGVTIGGVDYVIRKQMLDDFRSHDLPAILRRTSKPTLLFHSPEDETLGYENMLRLFGFLTNRNEGDAEASMASMVTIPGADHLFVKDDADLEFVANTIAVWCERILLLN
ncbi:MAG: alpha/beta fold hydrolase [Planctomycetota bacterium]